MGNLTLKNRPKGLLIKSNLHVCVQGQESHSLTAVPSSFVLFCLCWALANLLLTDWLVDRLIDWLIDWLIVIISVLVAFFCFVCVLFRVSVFASVELFSAHTHTHTYTHTHTHTHKHNMYIIHTTTYTFTQVEGWWWYKFMTQGTEAFNSSSGSFCGEDVRGGRHMCCYTTRPGSSHGSRVGTAT